MAKSGLIFEKFVKNILLNVGFYDVKPDNFLIYNGSPGKMIHGLGQPHNADVLMEPPFQTPFYYPTRLIIECKDYANGVGLDVVRSAVGLRDDINHFEIIDGNTLQNRRNMKRRKNALVAYDRFHYQVAIASSSRFTMPAQEFAHAHRINLITFDNFPLFDQVKRVFSKYNLLLDNIPGGVKNNYDDEIDDIRTKEIKEKLDHLWSIIQSENIQSYKNTNYTMLNYINDISLAVTSHGLVIFLYDFEQNNKNNLSSFEYEMYYDIDDIKQWTLITKEKKYKFVLPQYYNDILNNNLNHKTKYRERDMKINYFGTLVLFLNRSHPRIMSLSQTFIISILYND